MFAWTRRPELNPCLRTKSESTPMPMIQVIPESEATGLLAETYAAIRAQSGDVANIHRIHSLRPEALAAQFAMYRTIMLGENMELCRSEIELIATAVSIENSCDYCASLHAAALAQTCEQEGEPNPTVPSPELGEWNLTSRQRAILDTAAKLAHTPQAMADEDIACLRAEGLTDHGILELVLVSSYICFVNRIAMGLGVAEEI